MIKSMTGYGRAIHEAHGRIYTAEIKSVNHRYFDCTVKTSRMYGYLEDPVKKAVKDSVSRGKLDIYIGIDDVNSDDVVVEFNENVFGAYLKALRGMNTKYGLMGDVSALGIARMPEVFTVQRREADTDEIKTDVIEAVNKAMDEFSAMRSREGENMFADISSRAKAIGEMVDSIAERAPSVAAEYREKLTAKIREILDGAEPDEGRILTEAALFADKAAIDEEIVRLRSHLSQMDSMLAQDGPVGRKLDFLVQELNRESNTIGSKANDIEITRLVVDIKAEIEKIREQIQNIE